MTRRRSSSAATATRDDDFKIARCLGIRASDMSGIDADDELAQGIVQHAFAPTETSFSTRTSPGSPF
jgi:hypothetical protein